MKKLTILLVAGIAAAIPLFISGCGSGSQQGGPSVDAAMQKETARFDELVKKSDGVWDRLSPEEQKYMTEEHAAGDSAAAKSLLEGAAKRARTNAPGAPRKP